MAGQPQPQGSQRSMGPLADGVGAGEVVEEKAQQGPDKPSLCAPHPRANVGLCDKALPYPEGYLVRF